MAHQHTFWATVSGHDLADIVQQQHDVWDWGVAAVEIRTDLVPVELHEDVLRTVVRRGPTYVAHFGTGPQASAALRSLSEALASDAIDGVVCHSRLAGAADVSAEARRLGKGFIGAFHSQSPITVDEALAEYDYQASLNPIFRKIAARAHTVEQALALLTATHRASLGDGSPIVGAVFGPQRWARVAMPSVGSAVTFLIAHRVANELGGDDEQLTIEEMSAIGTIRGIVEVPHSAALSAAAST